MYKEKTEEKQLQKIHSICLNNNLVFASYKYPEADEIHTIIQTQSEPGTINNFDDITSCKGFLFSPFQNSKDNPVYIIKPDYYFTDFEIDDKLIEEIAKNARYNGYVDANKPGHEISKTDYINHINKTIREINSGFLEKVVLSRLIIHKGEFKNDIPDIFYSICKLYPNAFVFLVKIYNQFWIGASPEPLLSMDNGTVNTVSLAGTKQYKKDLLELNNWNEKELKEQEYVTLFIEKILSDFQISNYEKKGPYPKQAGHLLHLRTDITFSSSYIKSNIGKFIENLHPTPAVCGIPKSKALDYILKNEKHLREYYSGILGVVNMNEKLSLYVNLRSMKILNNRVQIYVGGGITSQSDPVEEWDETNSKAQTMLSVLKRINSLK